jgi:hypothetical protein
MRSLATANGTITNAAEIFRRFRLPRRAEVDSEILVRLADMAIGDNGIDPVAFLPLGAPCRGQLSAVDYHPGEVIAVGYRDGIEICRDTVRTAGAPARLRLEADRTTLKADGRDCACVTAALLDAADVVVPNADLAAGAWGLSKAASTQGQSR